MQNRPADPNPASATVLAIDDSPIVLSLLAARLKPEAIRLTTATSAEEGLARARADQPDLILLDVQMPGTSGLEICCTLKADSLTADIPIIFLTASTDIETKVRGFDLGAIDYVTKPFEPAELRARVRSALRMKRSQDLLTKRAQVDALTGLHNRAYLDDRLASEIAQARRTARPLSLVMIDLDHFKSLNDGYGHPFGDLVLQRVGDLLSRSTRPRDSACRYGGEELTLILPETSLDDAHGVAERLRVQLHALGLAPRGKEVAITASFGVSELSSMANGGLDVAPRDLVAAADQALYAAKHGGRDQVRCHTLPSANVAA